LDLYPTRGNRSGVVRFGTVDPRTGGPDAIVPGPSDSDPANTNGYRIIEFKPLPSDPAAHIAYRFGTCVD
jgi:hypothetical protein